MTWPTYSPGTPLVAQTHPMRQWGRETEIFRRVLPVDRPAPSVFELPRVAGFGASHFTPARIVVG